MKLTYFQLEQHLSKQLLPIYIVSGDELLLKHDALNWIRKAAKNAGFNERLRKTPGFNFEWDELYTLLYSNSLMQEKRLIELDCRNTTPNKIASLVLSEYANRLSPELMLVIDICKLDAKLNKSEWMRALQNIAGHVSIWPIARAELPQWILNRAKKYKLSIQRDAAELLADYVEGNLTAAAQTLEKIYLLRPLSNVDCTLLISILSDESHFTIFDLTEAILASDREKSLHILKNLQENDTEPTLILWSIVRELRMLATFSLQIKQGESYETLFQKHKLFSRKAILVRQFLQRNSLDKCFLNLMHAAEIDKIIKGARSANVWDSLQYFCLRLV